MNIYLRKHVWTILIFALYFFSLQLAQSETVVEPITPLPPTTQSMNLSDYADEDMISLDLKGVDVTDLLRILSQRANINITASKNVTGKVNLFLNNVTFEDAFEIIMVSQGLAYEQKGEGILYVMTATEYEALYGKRYTDRREVLIKNVDSIDPKRVMDTFAQLKSDVGKITLDEQSGTLIIIDVPEKIAFMEESYQKMLNAVETKVFELKYANAEDLRDEIQEALIPGTSEIYVDARTNKIAVSDLEGNLGYIEDLVEAFDERTPEVMIDARLLEVTLENDFRYGLDWERISNKVNGRIVDFSSNFPLGTTPTQVGTVTVGNLATDDFSIVLNAVESMGKTNVLSNPRVAVVSGEEAKILVGSREVFITQTLSQGEASTTTSESIEFIEVGVKLAVKPIVHRGGLVTITLKPEVSNVRNTITTALGSVVPIVDTSEAETTVSVKDGHSVLIGGLLTSDDAKSHEQLPFFGRIPILNNLIRTTTKDYTRRELVLFLSPRIMTGSSDVQSIAGAIKYPELSDKPNGLSNRKIQKVPKGTVWT